MSQTSEKNSRVRIPKSLMKTPLKTERKRVLQFKWTKKIPALQMSLTKTKEEDNASQSWAPNLKTINSPTKSRPPNIENLLQDFLRKSKKAVPVRNPRSLSICPNKRQS